MWELGYEENWVPKNWCFWTVVLETSLESPLDCKEIQPVHLKEISPEYSLKGLMLKLKLQYFGHLMWRADSLEKTLMMGKIEGGRRRGGQDEMVGWHHWLDGHEFEQALGVGDGQGSLVCCSPWSRKELDTTEWLNWLYVFLQKCLFRSSSHFSIGLFIFLISSYMSYLCILEINPLSFASVANIFSYLRVVFSFCLWFPLLCKRF